MTTALQRIRWHISLLAPRPDLTESSQESMVTFCVCVAALAICLVATGLELIGAL